MTLFENQTIHHLTTHPRPPSPIILPQADLGEEEGTPIRPRTLRERCGVTFFIHFTPVKLGGPPKGHLQPTVGNLPRRRRASVAAEPAHVLPVILDESRRNDFFSSTEE